MNESSPNILLITFDEMGQNILEGSLGQGVLQTPGLDRLAAEGVRFTQCTSPSPVCGPTRASVMTGLYPSCHGVWTNDIPPEPGLETIAGQLARAGYTTASIGKMHFTPMLEPWGFTVQHRTEDIPRVAEPRQDAYLRWLATQGVEYQCFAPERVETCPEGCYPFGRSGLPAELHQDHWVADRSIQFLEGNDGSPFFMWTSFIGPHDPVNPPAPFDTMYDPVQMAPPTPPPAREDELTALHNQHVWGAGQSAPELDEQTVRRFRAHYAGGVSFLDQQVGRILDALDRTGQAENTYVVFTTDHGEMLFDQGLREKGPWAYEPSLRVPLIVRGPGVRAGQSSPQLTSLVDLAPTFTQWAIGRDFHRDQQGKSIASLCQAEPAQPFRPHTVSEFGQTVKIVRDERYTFAYYPGREAFELFDRQADPDQRTNLAGQAEFLPLAFERLQQVVEFMAQCTGLRCEAKDITPAFAAGTRQYRPCFAPTAEELHHLVSGMTTEGLIEMFGPGPGR